MMEKEYRPPGNFSSALLRKIEKEGRMIYEEASHTPGFDKIKHQFRAYVLKKQATKYVQICLNQVWQAGMQTAIKAFRMRNDMDLHKTPDPAQEAIAQTIMQEEFENANNVGDNWVNPYSTPNT